MPPRAVKKTQAGSGTRRGGRTARGTPKSQKEKPVIETEEPVKESENKVEPKQDWDVVEVAEGKEAEAETEKVVKTETEAKAVENEGSSDKVEDDVKDPVHEYGKGEQLDLEDNEPEYEPEEYGTVDYDERGTKHTDAQEEGDEIREHIEGDKIREPEEGHEIRDPEVGDKIEEPEGADISEEEEGDMVEDVHEEFEGEEDDGHAEEEHAEMVDVSEEEHAEMVDVSEEEEHHEVVKQRRKRKEFEIFVGGLDKDATEDDLRKIFNHVGEITEVRLMMNPQTKKNKGFAFLRFATVEQAKRACTELKSPVVNGKKCGVTPSQDSDTLFLGNICNSWTKEALKEKLKHYGVDNVEDLTLVEDTNNEGMNRGFAFLEFFSRTEAMDAFKRLQKRGVVFGVDRPAKVSFADSFIDPGDEIMSQVKTVFIDGLSSTWDEDRVRELLKSYGKIEYIELARNRPSATRKDFGFVTFDTHDAAVTCAKNINNEELGEGDNKAKVRARLSRPLLRGRGKYGGHGDLRPGRGPPRGPRAPWNRPIPRSLPVRGTRVGKRLPPVVDRGFRRPAASRDRRPVIDMPTRGRPAASPSRSYDWRALVPSYPKSSFKREYGRLEEIPPPRSRAVMDYPSRVPSDRRVYRDTYSSRGSGYHDLPRGTSRTAPRRAYDDDGYGQRFERPPPDYREGRGREYYSLSGSKRPFTALDDIPPRYAEPGPRHSRARLDYELYGGSASQYGDAYSESSRLGRSNPGYESRSSLSSQDSHGMYRSRQSMGYDGGSYGGGSDVGGMYSSGYGGDYVPRSSDVDSYSSPYSSRGMGGRSYMGSGGSSSYY